MIIKKKTLISIGDFFWPLSLEAKAKVKVEGKGISKKFDLRAKIR